MYPYFFNLNFLDSYIIMICIGVIAALVLFRILSTKLGMEYNSFRFYGLILIASIGLGFCFSRLFQMLYNVIETGTVGKGITFLGGLIGGVFTFFMLAFFFGKKYRSDLLKTVNLAMPCIALGHCIGRIGCFLSGCCYGIQVANGNPFGVIFKAGSGAGVLRLPTQLFESFFLLLLCIALILFIFKFNKLDYTAVIYLYGYSIFRFWIEFLRDDHRGFFFLNLSPSQLISIIMFIGAIVLNVLIYKKRHKRLSSVPTQNTNDIDFSD